MLPLTFPSLSTHRETDQHSLDFALLTWLVRSEPSFLSTGKRKEMKWTRFLGDPQGLQFILRRPVGGNPTSRSTFSPKDLPNLKTQQKHPSFLWKRLLHIPPWTFNSLYHENYGNYVWLELLSSYCMPVCWGWCMMFLQVLTAEIFVSAILSNYSNFQNMINTVTPMLYNNLSWNCCFWISGFLFFPHMQL